MNNRKPTLKKKEPVWITFDDRLWSILATLLCDEELRHALFAAETEMPVIAF